MRIVPTVVCLALVLAASSCASPPNASAPIRPVTVAELEVSLTALERTAFVYTSLPPCGGASLVCADPAIKAWIKAIDRVAYDAVTAARRNPALVSVAVIAVAHLSEAVDKTGATSP
jgi:hypothetical protein